MSNTTIAILLTVITAQFTGLFFILRFPDDDTSRADSMARHPAGKGKNNG